MANSFKIILLTGILFSSLGSNAQNIWTEFEHLFVPPKNYVIYKTTSEVEIDGRANEADWKRAAWSEYFNDIEGDIKPKPLHPTRVKMLWDNENLYIYAKLQEPHIWAYYTTKDMIVYHENDFEVFIDPDRDTHNYYEFEVNAQNTLFDLFMNKAYRNGGHADIPWDAKGFKSAVYIDGTLNNPNDKDNFWTVEMAIPFSSLRTTGDFIQAKNGDVWKINFSRVNWQTDIIDGKYVRKVNPETKKRLPEFNWVWSPQGVINMHYPERWSMVQFSDTQVGGKKESFRLPKEEEFAKYLWLVYYKQRQYRSESGKYSSTLAQLDLTETGNEAGVSFQITLKSKAKNYEAILKSETGIEISINQEGLVRF